MVITRSEKSGGSSSSGNFDIFLNLSVCCFLFFSASKLGSEKNRDESLFFFCLQAGHSEHRRR